MLQNKKNAQTSHTNISCWNFIEINNFSNKSFGTNTFNLIPVTDMIQYILTNRNTYTMLLSVSKRGKKVKRQRNNFWFFWHLPFKHSMFLMFLPVTEPSYIQLDKRWNNHCITFLELNRNNSFTTSWLAFVDVFPPKVFYKQRTSVNLILEKQIHSCNNS